MLCLTFDTDHCNAQRVREWRAACKFPGRGTIFCTEEFPFLADHDFEIAPHPVLQNAADPTAEIKRWRSLIPKATCWRSHSLATSQVVSIRLGQEGYRISSTVEMFARGDIRPILSPWGVWEMPIYYMDNSDFNRPDYGTLGGLDIFDPTIIERATCGNALYVFDFHPVHYLLNTPSYSYYLEHSGKFRQGWDTASIRFNGYGVASFFDELVEAMRRTGLRSRTLPEALTNWTKENGSRPWGPASTEF
jgi:hypothetical protein